ncbi:unnamed protein product, partial [Mesorhabditis spiculigera]
MCMHCPRGTTTLHSGATVLQDCRVEICKSGQYLETESGKCLECGLGEYSDIDDARSCKKCPEGTTTYKKGSTSASNCSSTNQCVSGAHKCHWLAVCIDLPDEEGTARYACKCRPGFIGNGFNCADACHGLCENDAECLKTGDGRTKCLCRAGYIGKRCEKHLFTL